MPDWLPTSADESETERDGPFSTWREVHATVIGLAVGVTVVLTGAWEVAALFVLVALGVRLGSLQSAGLLEVRREPWYALGSFLVPIVADIALRGLA